MAGLLISVNNVFNVQFKSTKPLNLVQSEDISILLESGEYITAFIITEKLSIVLQRAMRRYVQDFERQFAKELRQNAVQTDKFENIGELIKTIFPFMKIRRFITGFDETDQ